MRRTFWGASFVLFALVAPALVIPTTAQGSTPAAPAPMNIPDSGLDEVPLDLVVDAAGKYAIVAVRPRAEAATSLTAQAKHLYVFDMATGQKVATARYPINVLPTDNFATFTAVLAPSPGASGATHYVVGATNKVALYALASPTTTQKFEFANGISVVGVGMNDGVSRVVAGTAFSAIGGPNADAFGNVSMFTVESDKLKPAWTFYTGAKVTALTMRSEVLAVATETQLFVFKGAALAASGTVTSCAKPNCLAYNVGSAASPNRIRHLSLSADGAYVLAGTENGDWLLFSTSNLDTSRAGGNHGDGAVKGVAMSEDAKSFVVAWNNGKARLYRHDKLASTIPVTLAYQASIPGTPAAATTATGSPVGVSMAANGDYWTATVGNFVHGFVATRPTPAWALDVGANGPIVEARLTADGQKIAVATGQTNTGKFLGYRQITKATIIPDTFVDPVDQRTKPLVGKKANPGDVVKYEFTLRNDGTTDDNYTFPWAVTPPSDWGLFNIPGFGLKPGDQRRVSVNVSVPGSALPQSYGFTLAVHSKLLGSNTGVITFYANVSKVAKVVIVPAAGQARNFTIRPGEPGEFSFSIVNQGNARALVNLSYSDQIPSRGGAWNVSILQQDRNVPVNGLQTVTFTGRIMAPTSALSGDHTILRINTYVRDPDVPGEETLVGNPLELKATLDPKYGVQLTSEKTEYLLEGGKRTPILVRVQNTGNTQERVLLNATIVPPTLTDKDWKLETPTNQVDIAEGGRTSTWTIYLRPLVEFPEAATVRIEALVKETQGTSDERKDQLNVAIDRVPVDRTPEPGLFNWIPAPGLALAGLAVLGAGLLRKRWSP